MGENYKWGKVACTVRATTREMTVNSTALPDAAAPESVPASVHMCMAREGKQDQTKYILNIMDEHVKW